MFYRTIGIIRVQVGVYHEIVYEASVFNRITGLGVASAVNLLNHLGFIDYFMIYTSCPVIIPTIICGPVGPLYYNIRL